jgi:hypothetical protein
MAAVSVEKVRPTDIFIKFFWACCDQDTDMLWTMIKSGEVSPSDITMAFLRACHNNLLLVLKLLLEKKVVSPDNFEDGFKTMYLDVVKYLINEAGAIPSEEALWFASSNGNLGIVKYMLELKGVAIPVDERTLHTAIYYQTNNAELYTHFNKNPRKLEKLKQNVPKYMKMVDQDIIADSLRKYINSQKYNNQLCFIAVAATVPRCNGAPRRVNSYLKLNDSRIIPDNLRFFNLFEQKPIAQTLADFLRI